MNLHTHLTTEAEAQTDASKTTYSPGRQPVAIKNGNYPNSYFPNTELLGPDEMRITALGTGMPNVTRNQASISYFVELGNGDKDTHGTTGLRQSYVGVKPRMAVGYHSTITPTTVIDINDGVRETYDGPLEIAQDLMVINVTKDQIVVREVSVYDNAYPPGTSQAYKDAKRSGEAKVSEDIEAGKWKGYTPPPMPEK